MGWWEVCFEGETGWVKKTYLTRKKLVKKTVSYQNKKISSSNLAPAKSPDVGFEPFLAKATTTTNFRTSPSVGSGVIRRLKSGSQLYVFSKQGANGFYKVIDIKTGKIGWVNKTVVIWTRKADVNYEGVFQSTGSTSNYNSDVLIRNSSSYKITLVVGDETFYLDPNSNETKSVPPGKIHYIATAPGVVPLPGYQTFGPYEGYEWGFWVERRSY